jgi:hypothetical protein
MQNLNQGFQSINVSYNGSFQNGVDTRAIDGETPTLPYKDAEVFLVKVQVALGNKGGVDTPAMIYDRSRILQTFLNAI